jgi:hypothetical protein
MIRPHARQLSVGAIAAVAAFVAVRAALADFASQPLAPAPFGAASPSQTVATPQQPHPAVARIIVPERDGTSYGSGTLVDATESQGLVITNWHVVENRSGPITVVFPDGFRSQATLLKGDATWDLAALSIWRPNVSPMPISSVRARPGEALAIAGYGSGNYRMALGRCTQYVAPSSRHPFEMVEVSAAARQGDSGGPIVNERGEMAGVLFGEGGGKTAGSDALRVAEFLAAIRGAGTAQVARLTANHVGSTAGDGWQPAEAARPFGVPFGQSRSPGAVPTDPIAGRIAPSNTTPQRGVTPADPRFVPSQGIAGPAPGPWTWPNGGQSGATPAATVPNATPAMPLANDARPSYPAPQSAATSIAPQSPPATSGTAAANGDVANFLGATRFEQAKSVLAIIGAIAIVVTFGRAFSKS